MKLSKNELDEMAKEAKRIAKAAGVIIGKGLNRVKTIEYKGEVDIVTEFDRRSEDLIVQSVNNSFPTHAILTEERGFIGVSNSDFTWIVDPLDGTTNFAHSHPFVAVSIGLEHKGELVCGAISRPLAEKALAAGIKVIPFVAGDVEEVIEARLQGELPSSALAMPGCLGRRERFRRARCCEVPGQDELTGARRPNIGKRRKTMPRGDGTGPQGKGPGTGRGMGRCGTKGSDRPAGRPGQGGGSGMGQGRRSGSGNKRNRPGNN